MSRHPSIILSSHRLVFLSFLVAFLNKVLCALHHECIPFGANSHGSVKVHNDWNWRSSALFYHSDVVWQTDIPMFASEEEFLSPNWGQKFGKCTSDLYAVKLCPHDEKFLIHDLQNGKPVPVDKSNRFILAGSTYKYTFKVKEPTVLCIMLFQTPKHGAKERRFEIIPKNSSDSLFHKCQRDFTWICLELFIATCLGVVSAIHRAATKKRRLTKASSDIYSKSSILISVLTAVVAVIRAVSIHHATSKVNESSISSWILLRDGSTLILARNIGVLFILLGLVTSLSRDAGVPLTQLDITRCRKVILLPVVFHMMVLILPLSGRTLFIVQSLEKLFVTLSRLSILLRALRVWRRMKRTTGYSVNEAKVFQLTAIWIIVGSMCISLTGPVYKSMLIIFHAVIPSKIHLSNWLYLHQLFLRVVPATIIHSTYTTAFGHLSSFTCCYIALVLSVASSVISEPARPQAIKITA